MTTTYDPHHSQYLDEADVRGELTRVFDVCQSCRRCLDRCASFPAMFELVDRFDDRDAGRLTPAEQDRVIDLCFHCKLCAVDCPYTPDRHERALDFPRLMLRADAMCRAAGLQPARRRIAEQVMANTAAGGWVGRVANRVATASAGSNVRKAIAATTGVSSVRLLAPQAKQRFSTWFRRRTPALAAKRQGAVTVFPTCLVEYRDVQVGKDLVAVAEHNGIACSLSAAGCCGAPWLHAGDVARFSKIANDNVRTIAAEIRNGGGDVVVPEPTCAHVLTRDYVDYVDPARRLDAELVAEHTFDAAEYLVGIHRADGTELDTEFPGDVPTRITYHAACRLRARGVGLPGRDLMQLTGAEVRVVEQCSGIGGTWGLRDGNEAIAVPTAERLAARMTDDLTAGPAGGVTFTGDCSLANTAIEEQTGTAPSHPLSVIARAYGLGAD